MRAGPKALLALVSLALVSGGLWMWGRAPQGDEERAASEARAEAAVAARGVVADLQPLGRHRVTGTVSVRDQSSPGAVVSYKIRRLLPGDYRLQIHAKGDCGADDGNSAGPVIEGGALAELEGNEIGYLEGHEPLPTAAAAEAASLAGRSILVHAVVGGSPLACGVFRARY